MGADIAGACGQLVKKNQEEVGTAVDIEDVAGGATSQKREQLTRSVVGATENGKDETSASRSTPDSSPSWIESLSKEDLDRWTNILTVAATVSASCFLLSSVLVLRKR
jgi:hypothetical protein